MESKEYHSCYDGYSIKLNKLIPSILNEKYKLNLKYEKEIDINEIIKKEVEQLKVSNEQEVNKLKKEKEELLKSKDEQLRKSKAKEEEYKAKEEQLKRELEILKEKLENNDNNESTYESTSSSSSSEEETSEEEEKDELYLFLSKYKKEKYYNKLKENEINTIEEISYLDEEEMIEIGIPKMASRVLIRLSKKYSIVNK